MKEHEKQEKSGEEKLLEGVDEAKVLKDDLDRLTKERDEYLDGWRRAKADLINYKRDELKRLGEIAKFSNEEVLKDLISVLDSFELALSTLEKSEGKVEKGIYLIKSQLEDILKRQGLEKIKIGVNDKFDPRFHEAVGSIEGNGEPGNETGTIAEEIESGYMLYSKVLRPTRVKLFK
jgi:molecular chaperone GrpE